jgi:ketosteroid isomerase-like protein
MFAITGNETMESVEPKGMSAALKGTLLILLVAVLAAAGIFWAKTHSKPAVTIDPQASVIAVKAADTAWSKAAKAHDLEGVLSYYADDAFVMPPNQELASNKSGVRKAWTDLLVKGTTVEWTPGVAESAGSGEMVYVEGFYTAKIAAGKGKTTLDRGKYLSIWKKQPDGTWKSVANTWNSDLPLPGAAARR